MPILDTPIEVDDLPESDVIPPAQYKLRIDQVDVADADGSPMVDKNGVKFWKFAYSVVEGEYVNRKVFENYVPTSGSSKLKKILRACKFEDKKIADPDVLVGLELSATVKVEKSEAYGEQNRIGVYIVPMRVGEPAVSGLKARRK